MLWRPEPSVVKWRFLPHTSLQVTPEAKRDLAFQFELPWGLCLPKSVAETKFSFKQNWAYFAQAGDSLTVGTFVRPAPGWGERSFVCWALAQHIHTDTQGCACCAGARIPPPSWMVASLGQGLCSAWVPWLPLHSWAASSWPRARAQRDDVHLQNTV